jgi:hypothetical protein
MATRRSCATLMASCCAWSSHCRISDWCASYCPDTVGADVRHRYFVTTHFFGVSHGTNCCEIPSSVCVFWITFTTAAFWARCGAQRGVNGFVVYFGGVELTLASANAKVLASSRHCSYRPDGPPCPESISHRKMTVLSGERCRIFAVHFAGS